MGNQCCCKVEEPYQWCSEDHELNQPLNIYYDVEKTFGQKQNSTLFTRSGSILECPRVTETSDQEQSVFKSLALD